jgi:hypothetical protein
LIFSELLLYELLIEEEDSEDLDDELELERLEDLEYEE